MRIRGIMAGRKAQRSLTVDFAPAILGIFSPVSFLFHVERRKKARESFLSIDTTPRRHDGIYAAGSGHDDESAGLQYFFEFSKRLQITFILCDSYAVPARDADVFDRRTIDDEVKVIFRKVKLEKITELERNVRMPEGEALRL